ncbi:unnamed protein product [Choristocarpus tenellus]
MHDAGRRMETRQYRNDVIIRTSKVEYYNFEQRGSYRTRSVDETIRKGDRFETDCYYDSEGDTKMFGLGSENEMCIDFIFFYPAQDFFLGYCGYGFLCGGTLAEVTQLAGDSDFDREFGIYVGVNTNNGTVTSLTDDTSFTVQLMMIVLEGLVTVLMMVRVV